MEEMDTEDQPSTKSSGDSAINAKDAKTGVATDDKKAQPFTLRQLVSSADLRRPLLIACMLQAVQQFSGINAVFFYSQKMFEEAGIPAAGVPFAIIGTNTVNVIATVVSAFLVDKAGRRLMLLIPELVMAVDLIFLTISFSVQSSYNWLSYMSIVFVLIYVVGFAVSLGPLPMMVTAEMFRQGPRPIAMSVAGVSNWIFTFVVVIGFPILESVTGTYTFIIFSILLFAFVAFTYFFVPETKCKTFEQTAHHYIPGSPIDVQTTMFDDGAGTTVDDDEKTCGGVPEDGMSAKAEFAKCDEESAAKLNNSRCANDGMEMTDLTQES